MWPLEVGVLQGGWVEQQQQQQHAAAAAAAAALHTSGGNSGSNSTFAITPLFPPIEPANLK
eukprot:6097224-Prymnesium_polylepis.1